MGGGWWSAGLWGARGCQRARPRGCCDWACVRVHRPSRRWGARLPLQNKIQPPVRIPRQPRSAFQSNVTAREGCLPGEPWAPIRTRGPHHHTTLGRAPPLGDTQKCVARNQRGSGTRGGGGGAQHTLPGHWSAAVNRCSRALSLLGAAVWLDNTPPDKATACGRAWGHSSDGRQKPAPLWDDPSARESRQRR